MSSEAADRQCPFCKQWISVWATQCPHCHQAMQGAEAAGRASPVRERLDPPLARTADYPPRGRRERDEDYDDEDRPRRRRRGPERGDYADCPHCGSPGFAKRVSFTWWGGVVGPSMLSHVKCADCGRCYNGRTGADNTVGIVIYTVVGLAIGVAVVVGLAFLGAFR